MLAALVLASPTYRIVDLGAPPGVEAVQAVAINERSEVLLNADGRGYLWRNGRFLDFGKPAKSALTGDPGRAEPTALNDRSAAVGGQGGLGPVFMSGLSDVDAFVWRGRGMEDLRAGHTSEARAINNLGDVVGDGDHRGFARLRGKIVRLPVLSHATPADPSGEMNDVNRSEAVAIDDRRRILLNSTYGRDSSPPTRPFLLDGNALKAAPRPVPLPKGYPEAIGVALGSDGTVLAMAYRSGDPQRLPYLARGGRIVVLRAAARAPIRAAALNRRGEVVGSAVRRPEPPDSSPLLWRDGKEVPFPTFPGWRLLTATGINDKGQICGTGLHKGKTRAYVLSVREAAPSTGSRARP